MRVDIFLVQLAIVFLPGLIWAQIDAGYVAKKKSGQVEFIIRAFLFGLFSYAIVFIGYGLAGKSFSSVDIDASAQSGIVISDFVDEILSSVPTSFVLALMWAYMSKYKLLARFLIKIGATKKYGDEDIWDLTFNSSQARTEYVHVRDFDKGVTYTGWVSAFSETGRVRELLLRDAIVYDIKSENPAEAPLLYLARDESDVHIEFPFRGSTRSGRRGVLRWLMKVRGLRVKLMQVMGMSSEAD